MNSKEYSVQDLISNDSFCRLVKGTADNKEITKWDHWIEKSEENRKKARKAMAEIAGFQFSDPQLPDIDYEWKKLNEETASQSKFQMPVSKTYRKSSVYKWAVRVAAVLIVGITAGVGFYIYTPESQSATHLEQIIEEQTVTTEPGEQKTIRFSNDSKIVLNSNSKIIYSLQGDSRQPINVVIEGEAFFDAEGTAESQQNVFAVTTPDGVIRDIGTEFLVLVERDHSRVVLEEGKVQINRKGQDDSDEEISMSAGEMLEFDKSGVLKKQEVNTTFYTSWATGSMKFDQTSIRRFAGFIEQRFNVNVKIEDPELADIEIDGGIYYQSLEELVRSVSEVAGIPVYQSNDRDTVYIGEVTINQK